MKLIGTVSDLSSLAVDLGETGLYGSITCVRKTARFAGMKRRVEKDGLAKRTRTEVAFLFLANGYDPLRKSSQVLSEISSSKLIASLEFAVLRHCAMLLFLLLDTGALRSTFERRNRN
jgi:hypothetical protein